MRDVLQNLKQAFIPYVTLNRLGERGNTYSLSNRDSVLWKAKAICGTTSLRVTVLALFYESVKRRTKTIRKSKTTTTNWTNEVKPQIRQILKQYAPRMYGTLVLCLSLVYLLRSSKGNFPYIAYSTRFSRYWINSRMFEFVRCGLWINNKHQDILHTILMTVSRYPAAGKCFQNTPYIPNAWAFVRTGNYESCVFFAPKGTLSCFGSEEVPSWKLRGSLFTLSYKLNVEVNRELRRFEDGTSSFPKQDRVPLGAKPLSRN